VSSKLFIVKLIIQDVKNSLNLMSLERHHVKQQNMPLNSQ